MWPALILVNGRPRYPQSQGSVERSNGSLKDSLAAWMRDNNSTNWSLGLLFVQWALNTSYHEATGVVPCNAVFGMKPRNGLKTYLPLKFLQKIQTGIEEEKLEEIIDQTCRLVIKFHNSNIIINQKKISTEESHAAHPIVGDEISESDSVRTEFCCCPESHESQQLVVNADGQLHETAESETITYVIICDSAKALSDGRNFTAPISSAADCPEIE